LSERYEIKTFSEVGTLDDQEWHLALEMPTSRMAHAERERESTPAKQHQGKARATKAQQDLPANMAINSRLLACKAYREKLYLYAKPALRVSPYFHVLPSSPID
jgi:multidrug resistance efflux pump